ncbi:MAG TPA: alpha/beta hydrolase-fold protein [bacterium]|nr:alpha/beta hydrolase-fold protein [bacterium]
MLELEGRVIVEQIALDALRDNPLDDPWVRSIPVYLPPGYDEGAHRYPVIYWLHGFGGTALGQITPHPWTPSLPALIDRVIRGGAPPVLLVMADGWTRFGGSQYVNSSANGRYEDAMRELVTHIDARFRTLASREHRGIDGKSSGGYGALALGMRNPDLFGGMASHSGDLYFEACFQGGFWKALDTIRKHGGLDGFLDAFQRAPKKTEEMTRTLATLVAMAMAYSPNPASPHRFDLPVDIHTGEIDETVWRRWQVWDPVRMVEQHVETLRTMRAIYFECGSRDQYNGHFGARMLHRRMEQLDIPHEYQEFDDDHTAVNYRYVESLRRLCAALAP